MATESLRRFAPGILFAGQPTVAYSAAPPASGHSRIGFVKRVPIGAMRRSGKCGAGALRPKDVYFWSYGLQMCRIHTVADPAEVIELEPVRDSANEQRVRVAVGLDGLLWFQDFCEVAVSIRQSTLPKPARLRFLNVPPEAVSRGLRDSLAGHVERTAVVLSTQSAALTPDCAAGDGTEVDRSGHVVILQHQGYCCYGGNL